MMAPTRPDELFGEILAYVAFDAADRARLAALHARLEPQLPAIADVFYARIAANPAAAALIENEAQGARLRITLVNWMASGLLGPHDQAFYERRSRIGRKHVGLGMPQHYMFTAMNVVRGEYDDRITGLYDPAEARLVARSVDKLFDIELALMLRSYQLDSEARLVARERSAQAERVTAIQTMSAGLAHEVRNPLNSAKLQLELLERRLRRETNNAQVVEPIEVVRHEIDRLTRMLNEFLAFARPSELDLGEHDLVSIARDVVDAERALAETRSANVELVGDGRVVARVDGTKLHQIIQHLVRNAIEAVEPGGHVTVTIEGDVDHVHVRVQDDGPGIPPPIQRRIYEPFFSRKSSGTGLGMSIVHSMVTLHGGKIAVDSTGQGTRFDIAMPRRPR